MILNLICFVKIKNTVSKLYSLVGLKEEDLRVTKVFDVLYLDQLYGYMANRGLHVWS